MRHVEIVWLRAGSRNASSAGLLDLLLTASDTFEVVADADYLCDFIHQSLELVGDDGLKLHGPLFARDVRRFDIAHEPRRVRVDPDIEFVVEDLANDLLYNVGRQNVLRQDGFEIRLNDYTAVECRDRLVELQRFDQHGHPLRRAPAGDGELDTGLAQFEDRLNRALGENFVVGHQCAIHVGDHESYRLAVTTRGLRHRFPFDRGISSVYCSS